MEAETAGVGWEGGGCRIYGKYLAQHSKRSWSDEHSPLGCSAEAGEARARDELQGKRRREMATGQFVFPGAEEKTAAAVATSTWGALQRRQLGWRGTT